MNERYSDSLFLSGKVFFSLLGAFIWALTLRQSLLRMFVRSYSLSKRDCHQNLTHTFNKLLSESFIGIFDTKQLE